MSNETSRSSDFSEEFAREAAERVARIWKERTAEQLQSHEMQDLADSIWECFCLRRIPLETLEAVI